MNGFNKEIDTMFMNEGIRKGSDIKVEKKPAKIRHISPMRDVDIIPILYHKLLGYVTSHHFKK